GKTSRGDSLPRPRRKADISASDSLRDVFDAVVVGAGPSGGMAARQLAAAGFRTAILDKKKVVGEPVQCAEGVSEFGLESNGLRPREEWIAQRVSGAKCRSEEHTSELQSR